MVCLKDIHTLATFLQTTDLRDMMPLIRIPDNYGLTGLFYEEKKAADSNKGSITDHK